MIDFPIAFLSLLLVDLLYYIFYKQASFLDVSFLMYHMLVFCSFLLKSNVNN